MKVHALDHLWTFTMPGRDYEGRGDPVRSRRDLMSGGNVVRTRLVQLEAFRNFVAVVELQKDGTAHLHVGARRFVPWELVSRLAKQAHLGYVWVSGSGHVGVVKFPESGVLRSSGPTSPNT